MHLSRNKLYRVLTTLLTAGYVWLFINYGANLPYGKVKGSFCFFKHVTSVPCPSCGSTRSVLFLLKGEVIDSLNLNPLGAIVFLIMMITPVWLLSDYLLKKESLFSFYKKIEESCRQKKVAIPAISVVLLNWIWNIYKGL